MRLLFVIPSLNPKDGGMVEAVRSFCVGLHAAGHEVEAAALDSPGDPWLAEFPALTHALGPRLVGYGYTRGYLGWLRAHAGDFDAVIVNGLWQYTGLGAWRALRGGGVPYFVFPHGMLDPVFQTRHPLKHLKKQLYWRLAEYRVLRDARAVLFTCAEEREQARHSFSPSQRREQIVELGFALPRIDPPAQMEAFFQRWPHLRGKRLLLFLSRLHEKKGCDLLIRAFAELQKSGASGGAEWHLVLAGPCSDGAYEQSLRTLAAEVCAPGSFTFTSMLQGDLKWGAFAAAEVFMLPSHQENFGLAIVEALALGVPVLTTQRVNIWREIEADGAALIEPDTLVGATALLQRWSALPAESAAAMRRAGTDSFARRFHAREAAERLVRVLRTCGVLETRQTETPRR